MSEVYFIDCMEILDSLLLEHTGLGYNNLTVITWNISLSSKN